MRPLPAAAAPVSPAEIENEKWLFPWLFGKRVPFSRWLIPLPVLVCQLCIGSLYSWSIFNSTLDKVRRRARAAPQ